MNAKQLAAIALTLIIVVPIGLGYALNTEQHDVTVSEVADSFNVSDVMLNSLTPYYGTISGPTVNGPLMVGSTTFPGGEHLSDPRIISPQFIRTGNTVTSTPAYSWVSDQLHSSGALEIVRTDDYAFYTSNSTHLVTRTGETIDVGRNVDVFHYSSGFTVVNGKTYDNIVKIIVSPQFVIGGSVTLDIAHTTQMLQFSDISYGWRLAPALTAAPIVWTCGHDCRSVCIMAEVTDSLTLTPRTEGTAHDPIAITTADGIASVNGEALGAYRFLEIIIGKDSTEVYGINAWPGMGLSASRMNSVLLEGTGEDFDTVALAVGSSVLRVDSAEVVAGQFPSTKDYTLDLETLYPGKDMAVRINSVGIYGDSIGLSSRELAWFSAAYSLGPGTIPVPASTYEVELRSWTPSSEGWSGISCNGANFDIVDGRLMLDGVIDYGDADGSKWRWEPREDGRFDFLVNDRRVIDVSAADSFKLRVYAEHPDTSYPGGPYTSPDARFSFYRWTDTTTDLEISDGLLQLPDGAEIPVVGALFDWREDEQGYELIVNGIPTGIITAGTALTFGGEWSLTATAYRTEQRTESVEEWVPGGFALDKTGVCAAGIAVCGLVFIGLGMTGRMQGSKAALLLLICGGAAAFYLMLI